MKIRYELTMDDIVAFRRHHYAQSGILLRLEIGLGTIVGIAVVAASLWSDRGPDVVTRLAEAAIFWVVFMVLFHFAIPWNFERHMRMQRKSRKDGPLGEHELVIDDGGITEWTQTSESRHAWSSIVRIDETDDHVFVYVSAHAAHVIPKNGITTGDVESFLGFAREMLADTSSP